MKFSRLFKKNVCHAILLGFTSQLMGTFALAIEPTPPTRAKQKTAEYLELQESGLESLIGELVAKAAADNMEYAPSPALLRCYERVTNGYKTLLVEDVMKAMPELLCYAFEKYDALTNASRSSRPSATQSWDDVKVPKPAASGSSSAGTSSEDPTDNELVKLLLILKKRIGTIHDSSSLNSILGILGDASSVFGPNSNISLKIKEVLDTVENDFATAMNTLNTLQTNLNTGVSDIENLVTSDFEHTWELLSGMQSDHNAMNTQLGARFDTLEQLIAQQPSNNSSSSSSSHGSSRDILKALREQTEVISNKFENTWDVMEKDRENIQYRLHEQDILAKNETDFLVHKLNEQTQEIKHMLEKQPAVIEIKDQEKIIVSCDLKEIKKTIAEQSKDIKESVLHTQKLLKDEFEDQNKSLHHKLHDNAELVEKQTEILTHRLHQQDKYNEELLEKQTDALTHKLHAQDRFIEEKFKEEAKFLDHKFHKQAELIEEQTKKILHHAPHGTTHVPTEFSSKQAEHELHQLHELFKKESKEIKHLIKKQPDHLLKEIKQAISEHPVQLHVDVTELKEKVTFVCDQKEIKNDIADCCEEIIATITECCEDTHELIDEKTKELKQTVKKQAKNVICAVADLSQTITQCCDDLADDIYCTQKLICESNKEQTKEIKHLIHRQTEVLTDEIDDVITTVTECCEHLSDQIDDLKYLSKEQTDEIIERINKRTNLITCGIIDLKETLTECCDDLADDIFYTQKLLCDGFTEQAELLKHAFEKVDDQLETIDCKLGKSKLCRSHKPFEQVLPALDVIHDEQIEQTKELKHKINRQTEILSDELDSLLETVTECCESMADGLCDIAQLVDEVADSVLCTQKLICEGFKEQTTFINHKFHQQADLIEDQTDEIIERINKRTNLLACGIIDLKETLTACCDDLADDIFCTQKLICEGFTDQTKFINHKFHTQKEFIEDQTQEIKHKISRQTEILTDELDSLVETVTECCENVTEGLCDIAQLIDEVADGILCTQKMICEGFKDQTAFINHKFNKQADLIEDQTKEIKHKISRQTENLTDEIAEVISTVTECCEDLHDAIEDTAQLTCKGFEQVDYLICEQTEFLACGICDVKETVMECCDDLADDIYATQTLIIACCKQTQSLIEECCEETHSLIIDCCEETQSLIAECCEETHSLIIDCCEQTNSNFIHTWSLINNVEQTLTQCCEQTQSNFEHTWSLIEHLQVSVTVDFTEILTTLSADFNKTWSLIDACCEQTQSNFVHTWSLINNVEQTLTQCCEQTQSNFEHTWSLIEHLQVSVTVDFTEILTTLSADFNKTWSIIDACCEQTQSNFVHTWSLINNIEQTLTQCCEQTQSNFEHTWSLINNIEHSVTQCCEQTQSNFAHTWSIIEECCEDLHEELELTLSTIIECCDQTQSNFAHTWSLINDVEHTLTQCCEDLHDILGSSTDTIVSFSCTSTSINNLDVSAISLLKTLLLQSCNSSCWNLSINETGSSLNDFIQTDGVWTTNGSVITTTAVPFEINALQYKYLQPAYQVLQVEIEFPNTQPPNVTNAVVGGLLFYWNGSDETQAGPLTCYMHFNTDASGQVVPGSSAVNLEVFRSGGGTGTISYPILLDTYYQMTIIISPYNLMSVYINDVLIAQTNTTTSWPGQVLGGYVGFWAAFGTVNFKNFKSWLPQPFPI